MFITIYDIRVQSNIRHLIDSNFINTHIILLINNH